MSRFLLFVVDTTWGLLGQVSFRFCQKVRQEPQNFLIFGEITGRPYYTSHRVKTKFMEQFRTLSNIFFREWNKSGDESQPPALRWVGQWTKSKLTR